jgi:hypothetical protein
MIRVTRGGANLRAEGMLVRERAGSSTFIVHVGNKCVIGSQTKLNSRTNTGRKSIKSGSKADSEKRGLSAMLLTEKRKCLGTWIVTTLCSNKIQEPQEYEM